MGNLAKPRLSPVAISQNMKLAVNLADTYSSKVFSGNMGHPEPIKIAIIKKCPKLLSIYGRTSFREGSN